MDQKCSLTFTKNVLRISEPILQRRLSLRMMKIFLNKPCIQRLISWIRLKVSELNMLKGITQHYVALRRHNMVIIFSENCGLATSISLRSQQLTNLLNFMCLWPLIFLTTQQVDNGSSTCCCPLVIKFLFFLCSSSSFYVTIIFPTLSHCSSTLYFLIYYRFIILMLMFVKRVLKRCIYLLIFFVVYEEIIRGFLVARGKQ